MTTKISLGHSPDNKEVWLRIDDCFKHVLIASPTGYGKSRLISLLTLYIAPHYGFLLPDRVGSTARLVNGHLTELRHSLTEEQKRKILYWQISRELIRLDPFVSDLTGRRYINELHAKICTLKRYMARNQGIGGDLREQMRRSRVMSLVLWLVGIRDTHGRYMGLHRALDILYGLGSPAVNRIISKRRSLLPDKISRGLVRLQKLPSSQREREIESSINIFDSVLSPRVLEIVAPGECSFDPNRAVDEQWSVIADLADDDGCAAEDADSITSMLLTMFMIAGRRVKKRFFLILEEIETLLGADVGDFLARARNSKQSCIYSIQHISSLRDNYTDITQKGISQADLVFSGHYKDTESLDLFSVVHAIGEIDYSINWLPMDRPGGQAVIQLPEHSRQHTESVVRKLSRARNRTQTITREESKKTSVGQGWHTGQEVASSSAVTNRQQMQKSYVAQLKDPFVLR